MKFKIDMTTAIILILVIVGITIFIVNFFTFSSMIVSLISIAIIVTDPIILEYNKYKERKEIEERFPDFLRDVTENIRTGMTLTQAVIATKDNYYGALTPYVRKMVVKIDWSIPFNKVLTDFSKKSTPLIQKTVSTIIETYEGGGDITQILDASGQTVKEINKVRKERSSSIYNQMLTGYLIFFLFIGILIILQTVILPHLSALAEEQVSGIDFNTLTNIFSTTFQWLIIIEGLFSGLVVGKLAEGSMVAGLKHSLIFTVVGYGAFLLLI